MFICVFLVISLFDYLHEMSSVYTSVAVYDGFSHRASHAYLPALAEVTFSKSICIPTCQVPSGRDMFSG